MPALDNTVSPRVRYELAGRSNSVDIIQCSLALSFWALCESTSLTATRQSSTNYLRDLGLPWGESEEISNQISWETEAIYRLWGAGSVQLYYYFNVRPCIRITPRDISLTSAPYSNIQRMT